MSDDSTPADPRLQILRDAAFTERYANNARVESSVWDLKLLFGTLDQGTPDPDAFPPSVRFHTSVAVPWMQAKVLLYNMYVSIMFYERRNGPISLPDNVKPATLREFYEGTDEEASAEPVIERSERIWKELFGGQ